MKPDWDFEAWVPDTSERPAVVVGHTIAETREVLDGTIKSLRATYPEMRFVIATSVVGDALADLTDASATEAGDL